MQLKLLLDKLLANVSMYLAMAIALFALFGYAFMLSLTGELSFRPLDMATSLAIFMGVSYGASYIFAYLFSVKAHHKSALITGGILFFIFSPVLTLPNAIVYAFIAVLAIASKYVLVWRGRHLFNPAAVAAVIASVTGMSFASWWVASLPLAIPVTILAFIILYKTQRLQLAGVFLASYILTVVAAAFFGGQPASTLLVWTLAVWWPLYFAGFMLSEPQTLPPRRRQYLIVAAIVAVLIGLHPSIGNFYVTPEVALIVGNIFGFLFSRRSGIQLKLAKRITHPGNQETFVFTPRHPFAFSAGQYMEVTLPHGRADFRGERRMFTIASAPEEGTVNMTTRYAEKSSTFKRTLKDLKKGDVVPVVAIRGDFTLPDDSLRKLLFIAGGIGITPFRSQLESLYRKNEKRDIILVYSVRHEDEVLFEELLANAQPFVRVVVVAPSAKLGQLNRVNAQRIDEALLRREVKDIAERDVYISGPPAMVDGMRKIAKRLGAKRIKTDDFTGY